MKKIIMFSLLVVLLSMTYGQNNGYFPNIGDKIDTTIYKQTNKDVGFISWAPKDNTVCFRYGNKWLTNNIATESDGTIFYISYMVVLQDETTHMDRLTSLLAFFGEDGYINGKNGVYRNMTALLLQNTDNKPMICMTSVKLENGIGFMLMFSSKGFPEFIEK